jgi:PAS domain S-box-containing protein
VLAGEIELRRLFDLSRQMICIAGMDGYLKRINPGFERMLGFSCEELLSRPFVEFAHPDDRQTIAKEFDKLANGGLTVDLTIRCRTKGGSYRWLTWSIIPRSDGLVYATATDVTELKSSQELSDSLLYHAPDPVIITDNDGRILRVNELVTSVFGYARDELVGKPIELLVPERLRGAHAGHRHGYHANPHVRSMGAGVELSAVRRDGTEFPAEISLGPVETDEGTIIICSVRDISERKRKELVHLEQKGELLAAARIQERLRPQSDPLLPGFDIGGICRPCVYAAGDLYDFFPMSGKTIGIVVGDVAGHGFSSALLMASTQAHIRSIVNSGLDIDRIMERTNTAVEKETDVDRFVTLFLARLDHETGAFTYVNAGHRTGYVIDSSGGIKACLKSSGIPIGVYPDVKFPIGGSIVLEKGDILILPTDGILEATSPSDEEFGDERLLQTVRENRDRSAREIIDRILSSSLRFAGRDQLEDDATVVVVKCHLDTGDH